DLPGDGSRFFVCWAAESKCPSLIWATRSLVGAEGSMSSSSPSALYRLSYARSAEPISPSSAARRITIRQAASCTGSVMRTASGQKPPLGPGQRLIFVRLFKTADQSLVHLGACGYDPFPEDGADIVVAEKKHLACARLFQQDLRRLTHRDLA